MISADGVRINNLSLEAATTGLCPLSPGCQSSTNTFTHSSPIQGYGPIRVIAGMTQAGMLKALASSRINRGEQVWLGNERVTERVMNVERRNVTGHIP